MSVDFSNVKIGDRIKLTNTQGDEHVFEVSKHSSRGTYLEDRHARDYYCEDWDTLEILEKPLPTKMGAIIHNGREESTYFILNSSGAWLNDSGGQISKESVRGFVRDGWKVVFEGLEYDA